MTVIINITATTINVIAFNFSILVNVVTVSADLNNLLHFHYHHYYSTLINVKIHFED